MQKRGQEKGFAPVYDKKSRVLILGSYPSPKSFAYGFYYGHPQNRFWPLLARLLKVAVPISIEEKKKILLQYYIALWDSLESCDILGASDISIKNPVPNDIDSLVKNSQINHVFCNGAAAYQYYTKLCEKSVGIKAIKLPSTSPANAAFSMDKLLQEWQPLVQSLSCEQ